MPLSPANSSGCGYPLGLAGAVAPTRFVGGTTSGAPAAGTFQVGDFVVTQDGGIEICTVAGSPGTWVAVTGGGGGAVTREYKVTSDATEVVTGDGQLVICIPSEYNGMLISAVACYVTTAGSSGTVTVQIRNVTDAADVLSTALTIDVNETTSYTASTPAVIDTAHDDVATGDLIAFDVDVVSTGAKGLGVFVTYS